MHLTKRDLLDSYLTSEVAQRLSWIKTYLNSRGGDGGEYLD